MDYEAIIRSTWTYEYYTDETLSFNPQYAYIFFYHDNGYSIEAMDFEKLYKRSEEIGEERIIAVDKNMSKLCKFAYKYLQELVDDEGVDIDEAYLQLPSGKWMEFKNESNRK